MKKLPEVNKRKFENKICTIERICDQKKPELFNKIAEKFPEYQFDWIGDGELRNLLNSENINILGWKEKNEGLNILKETDIFILTSLWGGLPMSLLEAIYYKKVCIVSNCIGNRDVIVDKYNGLIANDLEEFILKLKNILDGNVNVEQITENAYKDVINNYNFEMIAQKYIDLYENVREKELTK